MDFSSIFLSEALGTGILILLGAGVVANVLLTKSKGFDGGWLLITFGWGLGVFGGVYVAYKSGGHLNPAVTIGNLFAGADEYAPGVPVNFTNTLAYLSGQMVGAFVGACLAYAVYKKHFDAEPDEAKKLGIFATGPAIRSYGWNFVTEVIATFVLVLVILAFGHTPSGLGPLAAALLVVGIGASLGGPTGYAINPARDLGPRIAYALLPTQRAANVLPPQRVPADLSAGGGAHRRLAEDPGPDLPANRKDADWRYAWVPVFGPLAGGALAGLAAQAFL
ncbi:MIP/aquaporin family protein [Nocardia huaxiensis]|uniref:Aquaporin family protein n=1 Tax=Nocardia huaxiensis TaxID=2755382 RepID=A0A7D6ZPN5_9NOCA|nr:MIP/aquaporin family protein [Nocardia huaxiensis]QLY30605.1 aquaporin family protein [Nocardia huaxiensis]UFS95790.1 aquaporin family protein [Nocardia huaxiensis]